MGPELETRSLISRIGGAAILLALGATGSAEAGILVLSRHSGEMLGGAEAPIRWSDESRRTLPWVSLLGEPITTRTIGEAARIQVVANPGGPSRFRGPEWSVDVDADRIVVRSETSLDAPVGASDAVDSGAEVQVFGLVGPEQVTMQCPGTGVQVGSEARALPRRWLTLASELRRGILLCTGGAWAIRVGGGAARPYRGTFAWRPAPQRAPEAGETARQTRARRGSDVVFATTLGAYVAGVLASEADTLQGEARLALARVVAHDARAAHRHPGRPPCDTTHCQVFRGTVQPDSVERRALAMGPLPGDAWLPYFRGGTTPWSARRALGQVRALVGDVQTLSGEGQQIQVTSAEGTTTQPCEPLRSALRLPGCPRSVEFEGQFVVFRGMGQGHGLGLDVDAAARSNLDARTLLERAYGLHLSD